MANNCLVTKLKGTVNNNSLPRLGYIVFTLTTREGFSVTPFFQAYYATKAVIVGNAYFTNSGGTSNFGREITTFLSDYKFYITNITDGDLLFVEGKYDLTQIQIAEDYSNMFNCLKDNSTLDLNYCKSLIELRINKYITAVNFDMNDFTKTNGVISFVRWHFNSLLVGDIETIVKNLIANGKTSDSLVISANGSGIRLNGRTFMTGQKEHQYIKFNSANNVTVNYGDTYDENKIEASWDGSTWTYA